MAAARTVLACDVGGTNARLALVEVDLAARVATVRAREQVAVAEQDGLERPLRAFLDAHAGPGPRPAGCIGIAGTIIGRAAKVAGVNMPWTVDADALERACDVPHLELVNDFHAAARGTGWLRGDDLRALGGGPPLPGTPVAVIGAGTGLGQAFIIPVEGGRGRIVATEGGHRDFASRTPLEDRLLGWLRAQHGRVSTERVLSGPGLVNIYRFLVDAEGQPAAAEVEQVAPAAQGPIITRLALAESQPTCLRALETFVDVYGAEAGNVALTCLATGGVFIAGGIAPSVLTRPSHGARFRRAFEAKGRFADLLRGIPAWVVLNPDLGLLGAAAEAATFV